MTRDEHCFGPVPGSVVEQHDPGIAQLLQKGLGSGGDHLRLRPEPLQSECDHGRSCRHDPAVFDRNASPAERFGVLRRRLAWAVGYEGHGFAGIGQSGQCLDRTIYEVVPQPDHPVEVDQESVVSVREPHRARLLEVRVGCASCFPTHAHSRVPVPCPYS